MSELKAINAYQLTTNTEDSDVYIHNDEFGCGGDLVECYLKSEADKVIAGKDEEIAELKQKLHDAEMRADLAECAETERRVDYENLKKDLAYHARQIYFKHNRQTLRALCMLRFAFSKLMEYFIGNWDYDNVTERCERWNSRAEYWKAKAEEYK